jgi:hypothetical protein
MGLLGAEADWQPDFSNRIAATRNMQSLWMRSQNLRMAVRKCLPRTIRRPLHRWAATTFNEPPAPLDPALRAELTERFFREEILELQELLHRDLSHWLS